jgi:hypothetical protein
MICQNEPVMRECNCPNYISPEAPKWEEEKSAEEQ